MSHIATTKNEIKLISDYIDIVRTKGYNKNTIQDILECIIPQNSDYQVIPEISSKGYPAFFNGYGELIHINDIALNEYINKMLEQIIMLYPALDKQRIELHAYLTMFVLAHEVEHAYQYMIAEGYINTPYQLVKDGYKYITDFTYDEKWPKIWVSILIERYKQQKDKASFILERNANLEAYQLLYEVSKFENNEDMQRFLSNQYLWYSVCGYQNIKNNGSLEEAYRSIWRHKIYKMFDFTEDIPVQDRIRYGLPLDNNSRKLLLQKFMDLKDKK